MYNFWWGIVVVTTSTIGYLFAFQQQKKRNLSSALSLLVVCGFILRIYTALDANLHEWDERYHALVAKHLILHFLKPTLYETPILPYTFSEWTTNHIWLHKQPLPLWLIAVSLKTFGMHAWAVRLPSVILTTIGICLMYDLAKQLYNEHIAFIAAFLFSIHGAIVELSSGRRATDHIDISFMFFVLLACWLSVRHATKSNLRYAVAIGVAIGAAILCKWLPALVVIPIWMFFAHRNISKVKLLAHVLVALVATAIICLPWQLYATNHFHKEAIYEYAFNARHMSEALSGQGGNFFYHFEHLRMGYGDLIYLPVAWYTISSLMNKNFNAIGITLWFWLPYLFFSFCATKMPAYTLFAAPAIFVVTAVAFFKFKDGRQYAPRWLTLLFVYCLLLLPVRYSIERIKPFHMMTRNPDWNRAIEQFANTDANKSNTIVFNCEHFIEMMFATHVTAYNYLPSQQALLELRANGYQLWMQRGNMFVPLK
jgi:4-amino-4-deoxy-L-arabinose transferase-like glycosyltransferase